MSKLSCIKATRTAESMPSPWEEGCLCWLRVNPGLSWQVFGCVFHMFLKFAATNQVLFYLHAYYETSAGIPWRSWYVHYQISDHCRKGRFMMTKNEKRLIWSLSTLAEEFVFGLLSHASSLPRVQCTRKPTTENINQLEAYNFPCMQRSFCWKPWHAGLFVVHLWKPNGVSDIIPPNGGLITTLFVHRIVTWLHLFVHFMSGLQMSTTFTHCWAVQ